MIYSSKYIFFAAVIVFLIVPAEINACSCAGSGSPCEAYGEASAVFTGIVTGGSLIKIKDRGDEYQQLKLSFSIEENFRGVEGSVTEVITGLGYADCGFGFERGGRYLVYAYRSQEDKKLYTSICTRTRSLPEAGEDLKYLRGLSSASPGIISSVKYKKMPAQGRDQPGVKDIDQAISARIGEGERIEKYDLVLPPLPSESTITGVIVWSDGKPVRDAYIDYSEINRPIAYTIETDKEGRFSFKLYDGLKITMRANVYVGKKGIYSDYIEVAAMGEEIKVKLVIPR